MRSEGRCGIVGDRDGKDVRAGFTSFNLIIETEIIVITKASHALDISEWSWSFVLMSDVRNVRKEEKEVDVQSRPNQRQYK